MSSGWQVNELVRQLQQIYVLLDDGDRRALRAAGLTPTQFTLLRCVDDTVSNVVSISRLAELMLCTRGNVTRLVRRLEDAGLVSIGGDADDQRLVLVSVTEEGARRLSHARDLLDVANARRFAGVRPADLQAMSELADTVAGVLAKDLADVPDAARDGDRD